MTNAARPTARRRARPDLRPRGRAPDAGRLPPAPVPPLPTGRVAVAAQRARAALEGGGVRRAAARRNRAPRVAHGAVQLELHAAGRAAVARSDRGRAVSILLRGRSSRSEWNCEGIESCATFCRDFSRWYIALPCLVNFYVDVSIIVFIGCIQYIF